MHWDKRSQTRTNFARKDNNEIASFLSLTMLALRSWTVEKTAPATERNTLPNGLMGDVLKNARGLKGHTSTKCLTNFWTETEILYLTLMLCSFFFTMQRYLCPTEFRPRICSSTGSRLWTAVEIRMKFRCTHNLLERM